MRHILLFLLFFALSCTPKPAVKQQPVKRRPMQNSNFLNRNNIQSAQESLERIRVLEMGEAKEKSLLDEKEKTPPRYSNENLDEASYLREREALERKYGRNPQTSQEKTQPPFQDLTKPSSQDFPKNNPRPREVKQETQNEILEITGLQNKNTSFQERAVINPGNSPTVSPLISPPIVRQKQDISNFVISTSPAYLGKSLDDAKAILEQFGEVKVVKEGDMFSLKVSPSRGLATEYEAKNFMEEIIKSSFFDVFVEKTSK
jgi:hypothetical protein